MIEQRDLDGWQELMDEFFDSLPLLDPFYFAWKRASVTPGGSTYTTVFEAIPAFRVPRTSQSIIQPGLGEYVQEQIREIAVSKRWGETVEISGVVYLNGIQINDVITTQDSEDWKVIDKQSRGFGSYYVLRIGI